MSPTVHSQVKHATRIGWRWNVSTVFEGGELRREGWALRKKKAHRAARDARDQFWHLHHPEWSFPRSWWER